MVLPLIFLPERVAVSSPRQRLVFIEATRTPAGDVSLLFLWAVPAHTPVSMNSHVHTTYASMTRRSLWRFRFRQWPYCITLFAQSGTGAIKRLVTDMYLAF